MKPILLILTIIFSATTWAAGFPGKYKVEIAHEGYGTLTQEFLMNSSDETKTIAGDDNLYDVETERFFNDLTLKVRTWGDEDFSKFSFKLTKSGNKVELIENCGAFIDAKNDYTMEYGWQTATLYKWSKSKKKYVAFDNATAC